MGYRDFKRPQFDRRSHTTEDWVQWLELEGVLLPIAPAHRLSCTSCYGAAGYIDAVRQTWPRCSQCLGYGGVIDSYVPITYSIDHGLESILHRYKDFQGYGWLRGPLSSLLHEFIDGHGDCIEGLAPRQRIDVATVVPSNDRRGFNHLEELLAGVVDGDPLLSRWTWDMDFLSRESVTGRPGRGELKPLAYRVEPFVVEGSSVLLFDDTWTSGSSAVSAAAALKEAGATHVTVLTLGRQLNVNSNYGSSAELLSDRGGQRWEMGECVICA